jgi:hypothetical protein
MSNQGNGGNCPSAAGNPSGVGRGNVPRGKQAKAGFRDCGELRSGPLFYFTYVCNNCLHLGRPWVRFA